MAKYKKILNKGIQRLKLAQNRAITSFGLFLFTHNHKKLNVFIKKNVKYGKFRLQKFDIQVPKKQNTKKLPVVFYVHGGSWCGGDKYGYTMFCGKVAKRGYCVVNINYRLMPKVSIRTCVADCLKAIRFFKTGWKTVFEKCKLDCEPDFENVFLVGDSAGAHLVSLIAGLQTSKKIDLKMHISALGLYYGVYDFNNIANDPSPILTSLDEYFKSVCDDVQGLYSSISTISYMTKNYPPTFLTSGEIDKLHHQTELMNDELKRNDVEVEYLNFEKNRQDARHAFLNAPFLKSAREAYKTLMDFFEKHKQ